MTGHSGLRIGRRALLGLAPGLALWPTLALAEDFIGKADDVRGEVVARRTADTRSLTSGAGLMLKDSVESAEASFARLDLAGKTTIHLGAKARLLIDQFVAEAGGVLELGEGALVFDRDDSLPKIDLQVRSRFGVIAVRGTRFFAGPSKGVFGVFVDRGAVEVSAAGVSRRLTAGEGVDIAAPGEPPSEVGKWKAPRIAAAFESAGL